MGELVYRKELWTIKDRSEWWSGYCDAVEAAYAEAVKSGIHDNAPRGSRPYSGMYTSLTAGSGYMSGSGYIGSLRIGSGALYSGSIRNGSFPYTGSGTFEGAGSNIRRGGIMSLGYGLRLI